MVNGSALIDLGKLSEPATALVNRVSEGICGLAKPWQTRRVAQAEADAEIIKAIAGVEISEINERAIRRLIGEQTKQQGNIEIILHEAIPQLEDSAKPQLMDDDWIANFFDKCKLILSELLIS